MTGLLADGALAVYRGGGRLFAPFAGILLDARTRRGKEDAARRGERLGIASRPRPVGQLVWVHAASVGETMSVLPLIERLTASGRNVLLTTGTVTSAAMAATRLPAGAIHQFVPLDLPPFVRRFLDHWQPDAALFVESEIWPATLLDLDRRGIPRGLVNARMSERSLRRWLMAPPLARALFSGFALVAAQSPADAERFRPLGVADPQTTGNIKFDCVPLDHDAAELQRLTDLIGKRPVFLAASTHVGEETLGGTAARIIMGEIPDLLMVIVPRHPSRSAEIAAEMVAAGHTVAIRSKDEDPGASTTVYLADTLGELGLFYRLATVALVGGSLAPVGGHNPIEPAQLGTAILHGPHVHNARDVFRLLDEGRAARQVLDAQGLATAVVALIRDAEARTAMTEAAARIVAAAAGALDRTQALVEAHLLRTAHVQPQPGATA